MIPWSPQQHLNWYIEMSFAYTSERMDTSKDIGLGEKHYFILIIDKCISNMYELVV